MEFENMGALLIGAANYDDESVQNLPGVSNNLKYFQNLLEDEKYFGLPVNSVKSIENPGTPDELILSISEFLSENFDTILVYFAGHGWVQEGKHYFGTSISNVTRLSTSALESSELEIALAKSSSKRKILILDCCYSGKVGGINIYGAKMGQSNSDISQAEIANLSDQFDISGAAEGAVVMASSSEISESLTMSWQPHTVFTQELFSVIESGADIDKGTIEVDQIFAEIRSRITNKNELKIVPSLPTPQIKNFMDGSRIEFCRNIRYQYLSNVFDEVKYLFKSSLPSFDTVKETLRRNWAPKKGTIDKNDLATIFEQLCRDTTHIGLAAHLITRQPNNPEQAAQIVTVGSNNISEDFEGVKFPNPTVEVIDDIKMKIPPTNEESEPWLQWVRVEEKEIVKKDQDALKGALNRGQINFAKTPVRFGERHPSPLMKDKSFVPMIVGTYNLIKTHEEEVDVVLVALIPEDSLPEGTHPTDMTKKYLECILRSSPKRWINVTNIAAATGIEANQIEKQLKDCKDIFKTRNRFGNLQANWCGEQ